jgi:hypothetical protein
MTPRSWVFGLILSSLFTGACVAGPPFKTDDPEPVDYRHWEFYLASEQQFESRTSAATLPHVEINYGAAPGVQLHIVAPLGYVHGKDLTQYGYSDTELGVKYRFHEETDALPQVGIFPLVELPTGNANKQLGAGTAQMYLPVWIQKSWGKLTSYGGCGYWHAFGASPSNWLFAGTEAQYDFSEHLTLGAEIYYQSSGAPDPGAVAGFNVGGYLNITEHDHILFSLGRTATSTIVVSGYIGFQLTI